MIRRHVVVRGAVQGVFFRDSCRQQAERHRVSGWVTNRADGAVEAVFEGQLDDVEALVTWVRSGPPRARVDRVEVEVAEPQGDRRFRVV